MNNPQHNWLDMFNRVIQHTTSTENQPITDTIPAFATGILALVAKRAAIVLLAGKQEEEITGITKDKAAARKALDTITFATISPVVAYARSIGDNELRDKMKHAKSTIEELNDDSIVAWVTTRLNNINDIISSNPNPLIGYGITTASLSAWNDAIIAYDPQAASPQTAKDHRKTLTEELEELFSEGNDIIDNTLDPISIGFKQENPHFYSHYINATEIIDLGKGTTSLVALVQSDDDGTMKPVWKAKVSVDEREEESAITDIDGKAEIKPVKNGEVTVTVSHPDFQPQTTDPMKIIQGSTVSLEFVLIPV